MLTSGDVVDLDLGSPKGRGAGLRRPVVVTAQEILGESANVVQVVPLTSAIRPFGSEAEIQADRVEAMLGRRRCRRFGRF